MIYDRRHKNRKLGIRYVCWKDNVGFYFFGMDSKNVQGVGEMKTKKEVLKEIVSGKESGCIDGRDYARLCGFFGVEEWPKLGFSLKEGAVATKPTPWTKANILKQLKEDIAFGFEKALNQRGISSSFMYEVVKMWMWILDDELKDFEEYAQYGLPLFKAVAVKYKFPNEIGEDIGNENKYAG